ncbi:hypothetical protein BCR42DRAFT_424620 [Absidia repens]|uniref:Uncharacterized protein n=1 Tax=Absidia repens TaxID=90262 RepID=A0A1X2I3K3_9FUNG|nr:hypothetical protein BCR42DRAFT_424620 [Absidia repens]
MATTTYTSSSPSPLTKEWLSLPRDLAIDDSFADDLIRQFDNKRTGLHKDIQYDQQSQKSSSPLPTVVPTKASSNATSPTSINQARLNRVTTRTSSRASSVIGDTTSPPLDMNRNPRRTSAGDLLRRSSAFFKATLDHTWKNISRSNDNLRDKENLQQQESQENAETTPSLPATVAINTTITLPITKKASQSSFPPLQPPVISQYPPKPLQYSPVTPTDSSTDSPVSSHNNGTRQKTLIHRISMPALRRRISNFSNSNTNNTNTNSDQQADSSTSYRRKSDSANPLFIKRKKSNQA